MEEKINNYLFEDNIKRYFLKEMLIKKACLKNLTIKEIDSLVRDINILINNLNSAFKRGEKVINISDKNNWEGDNLFKNIILHNVLEIKNVWHGSEKDFKDKLINRWNLANKTKQR